MVSSSPIFPTECIETIIIMLKFIVGIMKKKNRKFQKIVIVGAGGQGKDVLWTIMDINKASNVFDVIGFMEKKLMDILYWVTLVGFQIKRK